MIKSGLIDEVKGLREKGYSPDLKSMQSIGYKHVNEYLDGQWSLDEMIDSLARDTRHYAKRQFTWFNRDKDIQWFEPGQVKEIEETINMVRRKDVVLQLTHLTNFENITTACVQF